MAPPQLAVITQEQAAGREGLAPPAPPIAPLGPLLRGDPHSPLSAGLGVARWPLGFKMPDVRPFEGCTDPLEFLRVYETAIEVAGGDDTIKAKSIALALRGMALTWFFTIPPCSIYAWEQLRDLVRNKFQRNYAEPKDVVHPFVI